VDEAGRVAFVIDPGIGGRVPHEPEKLAAPSPVPANAAKKGSMLGPDRKSYELVEVPSAAGGAPTRFLADNGQMNYRLREVKKLDAPKASLFALIIDGILTRKLPWDLVLIGVMLSLMMELCGIASLPFAVGVYLPISTSVPIFVGGVVRWLVDKKRGGNADDADFSPGTLLSSGYIAGGAIAGLCAAFVAGVGMESKFEMSHIVAAFSASNWSGILAFGALAAMLYSAAVRGQSATGK
jgi:hypothetical protein